MSIDQKIEKMNNEGTGKSSYTVEEVMYMIGIARQTVYKLIKSGCFDAILTKDGYRIMKESFDSWLDQE